MDFIQGIQNAIDYIEEGLLKEFDYEEIAKTAYVSSFHFQRIFSIVCGITLGEYIRNRRLSLSKDEVLNTNEKIIDIAYKYGYKTPDGYTRAFYRFFGVTPSAARNRRCNLNSFHKISVHKLIEGGSKDMSDLTKRGYSVVENGSVYYTHDMDRTKKWFDDILGWYADIAARSEDGVGTYGCASPVPDELLSMKIAEFKGIHMFYGKPIERTVGFIGIKGIENLYSFVKSNGWEEITEIQKQPWGGKTCNVTTIDNSVLTFCEID